MPRTPTAILYIGFRVYYGFRVQGLGYIMGLGFRVYYRVILGCCKRKWKLLYDKVIPTRGVGYRGLGRDIEGLGIE